MCEPISTSTAIALASAALSTGAGVYQSVRAGKDAQRAAEAQSQAALQELSRQRGYRDEAQSVLTRSLAGAEPGAREAAFNDAVAERQKVSAIAAPVAGQYAPAAPNAPSIVRSAFESAGAKAQQESDARTAALARTLAYGDVNQNAAINLGRSGQSLDQISGIARVSNSLNDLERNVAAQNAQKGPSLIADAARGVGDLGLYLALSGQIAKPKAVPATPSLKPRGKS